MTLRIGESKTYSTSDKIYEGKYITIFLLNMVTDKYLAVKTNEEKPIEFVITGLHKVTEVMSLAEQTEEDNMKELNRIIKSVSEQSYMKNLGKYNLDKLKVNASKSYENNFPLFVVLGMKVSDFILKVEKETNAC